MKKLLLFAALTTCLIIQSYTQVSTYTFSQSAGVYSPISGGTILGVPNNDDTNFPANPIGFSFCYNGVSYTTFGVNCNGWIQMGSGAMANSYTALSTGTGNNVIAALNYDIQGDAALGNLRYETIGTVPNRTLVVQWTAFDSYQSALNGDSYDFQIRLNETTNLVDIVYGTFVKDATTDLAQVGIRGNSNADFNNENVSATLPNTWATPIAGVANNATCELSATLLPVSGQTYTFTPPAPTVASSPVTFTAVTATGMTINWMDNSINEAGFLVEYSLDNVIFNTLTTVVSGTTGTTGTPYNYAATGLFSNTLYYIRITATNANCSNPYATGQQATLPGVLCGTYTVGPTGFYPSLTAAIADAALNGLSCPCNFELQAAYLSTVETFPINVPFVGSGPGTSITVRPELGATNLSITNGTANTIVFNGATYFGFDGRPGGLGTNRELTIENTATGFSAINYTGDGDNTGANYVKILGVTTGTTNGVISLGNSTTTAGKMNLYIRNSSFADGASTPQQYLYSANTLANSWTVMNLTNNTFEDWFQAGGITNAINIAAGNRGWNISNNEFYQTATRTFTTSNTHNIILVSTTTGSSGGNTISNNKFGGNDSTMAGYYTINGAVLTRLNIINATGNTSFANNTISNNTIKNFNFTTASTATTAPGVFCGILAAGTTNNFNILNNTIGSSTLSDSIMVSISVTGAMTVGISVTATGTNNITSNSVGGIKAYSTLPTLSSSILGLNVTGGAVNNISGNLIGSTTVTSNIVNAFSTSATAGLIDGIRVAGGTTQNLTNNTIAGITSLYNGTSATGALRGIYISTGLITVTGNTVSRLGTFATGTNATNTPTAAGIYYFGTTNGSTIANNNINNIFNVAPTAANVVVLGIGYNSTVTVGLDNLIRSNNISNLGAPLNTGAASIIGLDVQVGNVRGYNNFIDLGLDLLSASITAPNGFIGINKSTTASTRFLFNSVRIAGTGVNGAATNSFAFRRTTAGATDTLKANIFTNFRSNGSSTGKHYTISLNNNTTLAADRNVYYGNGTGYVFGSYLAADVNNLSTWSATTGGDLNSFFANPGFMSASDLHINGALVSIVESRAVGVTSINTDIDGDSRPGPAGSMNGGGTDPDVGADEVDAFPVTTDVGISLLVNPAASDCHGAADSVIVRLVNYASAAVIDFSVDNITINSSVAGPNPIVFPTIILNSGSLAGSGTMDIVVGINYDMTALGTYTFNASATTPLDFINSNDAMATANIVVSGGTSTVAPASICAGANTTLSNAGETVGGTYQWEVSQDGVIWSNVVGAITNPYVYTDMSSSSDTLYFRITSCGLHTSVFDTLMVDYVTPAVTNDTSRCGPGLLDLYASGSGSLSWYDMPAGGTLLDTGVVYTPYMSVTDTFYVENVGGGSGTQTVGAPNIAIGAGLQSTAPQWLIFDVFAPTTLQSMVIYPGSAGAVTLEQRLSDGVTVVNTYTHNVTAGEIGTAVTIPVNWNLTPGTAYRLYRVGTPTLYRNSTGAAYPYTAPGVVSITGNSFNPTYYYWGYNWTLSSGCPAVRTPLVATVTPAASISAYAVSGGTTCNNETDTLVITSLNTSYQYLWTPNTGLTDSTAMVTAANPQSTITYYLQAIDSANCQNFDTVTVIVNASPVINLFSSDSVICYGDTANLYLTMGPYVYSDSTDVTIPDSNPAGIDSPMLSVSGVSSSMTINSIDSVCFNMLHTFTADMDIYLESPLGTQISLVSDEGGAGLNFTSTCFSPNAVVPIAGAAAPFTGMFIPDDPTGFAAFNGENANGNWVLHMVDDLGGDIGILQDWSITFTAPNYVYTWNSTGGPLSDTTDSITVNPLVTTTYYITAIDTVNGCEKVDTVTLAVYDQLLMSTFASPVLTCVGGNDTLVAVVTGGEGNYTYLWSDGLGTNDSAFVSGIPFDYMLGVTVTDGCGSLTDSVLIDIVDPLVVTTTDISNCGPGTGFILGSIVTGGNGVYTYLWTGGATTPNMTTGLVSTTTPFTLTVTDGCTTVGTDISTVTINPLPVVNLGPDIVQPSPPALLDAGAGFSSYLWSTSATSQTINALVNGSYWVQVTDGNGCVNSDTIQVTFNAGINNPDGSNATVSYYPNPTNGLLNMNIQGFLGKELKMEVMDLQGKIIRNYVFGEVTESYSSQIDLSTLRAGTYLVVLRSNDDVYTHRIVITTQY